MDEEQSLRELVSQLMGKLFSFIPAPEGVLDAPAQYASKLVTSLAFGNTPTLDSVLVSNKTAQGIYDSTMRNRLSTLSSTVSTQASADVTRDSMASIAKMLTSFETFRKKRGLEDTTTARQAYEEEIARQISDTGFIGNVKSGMFGYIADMFGLDNAKAVGGNMGAVAYNIGRTALRHGDIADYTAGQEIATRFFRGDDNNPMLYKRRAWSGFSQKAVSELAKELSQSGDILQGVDVSKDDQLKSAVDKFRTRTKDVLEALKPLRDVFGEDIPSMTALVQEATGRAVANMSTQDIASVSRSLGNFYSNSLYSPNLTMKGLGESIRIADQFSNSNSGVVGIVNTNSAATAIAAEYMYSGGEFTPSGMRKDQYRAWVENYANQTSASTATDQMAMAYSIWRQNKVAAGVEGEALSFDAFDAEVKRQEESGVSRSHAERLVAGVSTVQELEAGRLLDGYQMVYRNGEAAAKVREKDRYNRVMSASRTLANSVGVRKALSLNDVGDGAYSKEQLNDLAVKAFDLIAKDGSLSAMSIDELASRFAQDASTSADAKALAVMIRSVEMSEDTGVKSARNINAAVGQERSWREQDRVRATRVKAMEMLDKEVFNPSNGLLHILDGGFSLNELRDKLAAGALIVNAAQGEDILATYAMAQQFGNAGGTDTEIIRGLQERMIAYSNSDESLANKGFLAAKKEYASLYSKWSDVKDNNERKADLESRMQEQAVLAGTYMTVSDKAVTEFLTSENIKDKNGAQVSREDRVKMLSDAYVRGENMAAWLDEQKLNYKIGFSDQAKELIDAVIKKRAKTIEEQQKEAEAAKKTGKPYTAKDLPAIRDAIVENIESRQKDINNRLSASGTSEDDKKALRQELDNLNSIAGEFNDSRVSAGTGANMSDLFGALTKAIEALVDFLKTKESSSLG